jgi:hypothetical protein
VVGTYRVPVNADERDEITASVAAHSELGSRYDAAVAEGLVERIGEEIDKRVDARMRSLGAGAGAGQQPAPKGYVSPGQQIVPPGYQGGQRSAAARAAASGAPEAADAHLPARRSGAVTGLILGLGSMGLGVGATAVVVSHQSSSAAQFLMVLLIWAAIAIINIANSQRR